MEIGRACNTDYALDRSGKQPAKDFLDGLDPAYSERFEALFEQLREQGYIWNIQKFKKLKGGDGIWEFIVRPYRMFCFRLG